MIKIYKSGFVWLFALALTFSCYGQGKFGALAIDKSNGNYFGWAVDYETQAEADKRALQECKDSGGNCSIVLRFGEGLCAEYRMAENVTVTAYGWGVATSRDEASRVAVAECLKRSNGSPCTGYVFGCNSKQATTEDDFWNGENKEKEVNINKDKEILDVNSAEQNNPETDFWDGKGTSDEERKFIENTKPDESDQFIGNVRSRTSRVRIFCVDTGEEDGDLVRITNNSSILKDDIYLTNAGKSYWFDLQFGQNNLEILALNQGKVGANTAAFKVFDEKGNLIAEKDWHLQTGYKGKLLILKL